MKNGLAGCGTIFALFEKQYSKQDAQKGCPARPQRVKARGVPLGYVEGLNDARTPLAGFFSILLRNDVAHKIVQSRIGDLDLDELPRCGCPIIDIDNTVDLRSQPFMASLKQ